MRLSILPAAVLAVLLLRSGANAPAAALSNCGTDRPDVQTLTDTNAGDVDTGPLIGVNLSTLASVPIPNGLASGTRYNPYETTVWATVGQLVQAQLEANGAIDLTLIDPDSGDTLLAVFPDVARCAGSADPSLLQYMQKAREAFVQAYGTPPLSGVLPLSGSAEVAGVGFIPASSAPNQGGSGSGIDLSPVLGFAPISSAASPSSAATAPPAGATPLPAATPPAGG